MGKEKYQERIRELFNKSPVVSYNSIGRNIGKNKPEYTKQLIRNLIKKNKIKRIAKGYYTIHEDPSIAVYCYKPSYLGLQDALSIHNLWEQETIPVIITTKKIRQGLRNINNTNILLRRIDKKYLFGIEYIESAKKNFYLPYSDIEKTFIDMIYFKENINKETLKTFKKIINKKKLSKYLKKYPKLIRNRVLRIYQREN